MNNSEKKYLLGIGLFSGIAFAATKLLSKPKSKLKARKNPSKNTLGSIWYIDPKEFNKIHKVGKSDNDLWNAFIDTQAFYEVQELSGGLDHVTVTPNQITFHDIGVSRGGKLYDSTFTLRRRKKKV